MKNKMKLSTLFLMLFAFVNLTIAQHQKANIKEWPETAQKAAKAMMEKYGEPHEQTESMLIWHDTEPFSHTIVYKEEVQHDFPMPHKDVLEQVIDYDVPVEKFTDLAKYDGSVIVERTKGTMAARCDKEAANFLALNLAHDIIKGRRTVEDAREYYADAVMKMMKGQMDPYMQSLEFEVPERNINNPDITVMDMAKVKELKKNK